MKPITRGAFDQNFTRSVEEASLAEVYACYQCGVCSGGCPVSFAMDYTPRQIIRMVQLGMMEEVLSSATIWLCSSCNTCFTRCPREIELPEVMASLKSIAISKGIKAKVSGGPALYNTMVELMKKYGRVNETELYMKFAQRTNIMNLFKQMPLAVKLAKKGKLKMLPDKVKSTDQLKKIFKNLEKQKKGATE